MYERFVGANEFVKDLRENSGIILNYEALCLFSWCAWRIDEDYS